MQDPRSRHLSFLCYLRMRQSFLECFHPVSNQFLFASTDDLKDRIRLTVGHVPCFKQSCIERPYPEVQHFQPMCRGHGRCQARHGSVSAFAGLRHFRRQRRFRRGWLDLTRRELPHAGRLRRWWGGGFNSYVFGCGLCFAGVATHRTILKHIPDSNDQHGPSSSECDEIFHVHILLWLSSSNGGGGAAGHGNA